MKIAPENLNMFVRVIRFGLLGIGAVFLLAFDWVVPAFACIGGAVAFNIALRFEGFRRWFVTTFVDHTKLSAQPAPSFVPKVQSSLGAAMDKMAEPPDLSAHDGMVAQMRQESILLKRAWPPHAADGALSYLGGLPCFPDGMAWPENPQTGVALHHLAQIDLSQMPRSEATSALPEHGTMWFFADINEEMIWNAEPDNGTSRVLYHPDAVAGIAPHPATANLPQVDHPINSLETLVTYRGPRPRVYPRWPVSGHLSGTWDIDNVPYEPGAFEAVDAAIVAERAPLVGQTQKPDSKFSPFKNVQEDLGEGRIRRSHAYVPDIAGARFPHTGGLALRTAQAFADAIEGQSEMLGRYSRNNAEDQNRRARLDAALPAVKDLTAKLRDVDPVAPLDPAALDAFDKVVRDLLGAHLFAVYPDKELRRAVITLVRDAFETPALLQNTPEGLLDVVRDVVLPAHENAHHYLLAARTAGANPTSGQGVRIAQFDSDYALGMMFCDVGIVDFWIDANDLAAGRWERAYATTAGG